MERADADVLNKLRRLMKGLNLHAYIIMYTDPHMNEYVAECDKLVQFMTGFTGSQAISAVTVDSAYFMTPMMNKLQAEIEVSAFWTRWTTEASETHDSLEVQFAKKLRSVLPTGSRVAFNLHTMSYAAWKDLEKGLTQLVPLKMNLVARVWRNRPRRPNGQIVALEEGNPKRIWGGLRTKRWEKLNNILKGLHRNQAILVTALDEIAWLLEWRGSDIPNNPLFFAYIFITPKLAHLFVNQERLSNCALEGLNGSLIRLLPYREEVIEAFLKNYVANHKSTKILVTTKINSFLVSAIPAHFWEIKKHTPLALAKCIKSNSEIIGMRNAHFQDSIALCRLLAWLEHQLLHSTKIKELDVVTKLDKFRSHRSKSVETRYVSPSFDTISASGPNSAVIHYKVTEATNRLLDQNEFFLIDAGAHYKFGTTDISRTVKFGPATDEEKNAFTAVVKAHIRAAMHTFYESTNLLEIDSKARSVIKALCDGYNYEHATSHGIGCFLTVHEDVPEFILGDGMAISIEPGYYKEGHFGVRIENIALVRSDKKEEPKSFLEIVSLVPIQTTLLNLDMLTDEEIEWINRYHKNCWQKLNSDPLIDERTRNWLCKWTEPIERKSNYCFCSKNKRNRASLNRT